MTADEKKKCVTPKVKQTPAMVVLNPGDKSWGNDASGLGRGIGPIRVAWLNT